jgi:hypothetical protein
MLPQSASLDKKSEGNVILSSSEGKKSEVMLSVRPGKKKWSVNSAIEGEQRSYEALTCASSLVN